MTAKNQRRIERRLDAFLARLADRQSYIASVADPAGEAVGERLALCHGGTGEPETLARVDAGLFAFALAQGLVEPCGERRWQLAEAGRSWRRRQASASDPYSSQHGEVEVQTIEVGGARERARVNLAESPLVRLFRRKGRDGAPLLSQHQFAAGERLRSDFTRASLMPSVTSRWDLAGSREKHRSGGAGNGRDLLDSVIAARARVQKALATVGPEFADLLVDVCCFLKGLEEVERTNGWPARSGKLVLQLGLNALARHYGYLSASRSRGSAGIRHWGTPDYRPEL